MLDTIQFPSKKLCEITLAYISYKVGIKSTRPIPKIRYSRQHSKNFGTYNINSNTITIYEVPHLTVKNPIKEMVGTVIHEYKHYLQHKGSLRSEIQKSTDKLEREALAFEKKYLKIIEKDFLCLI